jgi:hypothetical protein
MVTSGSIAETGFGLAGTAFFSSPPDPAAGAAVADVEFVTLLLNATDGLEIPVNAEPVDLELSFESRREDTDPDQDPNGDDPQPGLPLALFGGIQPPLVMVDAPRSFGFSECTNPATGDAVAAVAPPGGESAAALPEAGASPGNGERAPTLEVAPPVAFKLVLNATDSANLARAGDGAVDEPAEPGISAPESSVFALKKQPAHAVSETSPALPDRGGNAVSRLDSTASRQDVETGNPAPEAASEKTQTVSRTVAGGERQDSSFAGQDSGASADSEPSTGDHGRHPQTFAMTTPVTPHRAAADDRIAAPRGMDATTPVRTIADPEPVAGGSVHAFQIKLESAGTPEPVQVHVRERAGEIRIDVRGPDLALNQELRQDLPSLLRNLEEQGFRSPAWIQASGEPALKAQAADAWADANRGTGQRESGEPSDGRREPSGQAPGEEQQPRHRRERRWERQWMAMTE